MLGAVALVFYVTFAGVPIPIEGAPPTVVLPVIEPVAAPAAR